MKDRITRRYLAGLLDGEGYIGIMNDNHSNRWFVPTIKISMTSPEAIKEVHLLLGGHIHIRTRHNWIHKNSYCWGVRTFKTVDKVLDYVHKYLIVKKPQADVLREFLNTKQNSRINNQHLRQEVLEKRQRLYYLMKKLNHRGNDRPQRLSERAPARDDAIVRAA